MESPCSFPPRVTLGIQVCQTFLPSAKRQDAPLPGPAHSHARGSKAKLHQGSFHLRLFRATSSSGVLLLPSDSLQRLERWHMLMLSLCLLEVEPKGIEPSLSVCKTDVLAVRPRPHGSQLVADLHHSRSDIGLPLWVD